MQQIHKILGVFKASLGAIRPNFFLVGSTGSGKTHMITTMCKDQELTLISINAATLTKEGISGASLSRLLAPLRELQGKPVVCLVDEFDKQFLSDTGQAKDVQDEFLKALETSVTIAGDYGKFTEVDTSKVLWVFAGAFKGKTIQSAEDLNGLGIKEEFIGRVPLVYRTNEPTLDELINTLNNSKLLSDYCKVLKQPHDVVATQLQDKLYQAAHNNTIGYRIINKLIHQHFIELT